MNKNGFLYSHVEKRRSNKGLFKGQQLCGSISGRASRAERKRLINSPSLFQVWTHSVDENGAHDSKVVTRDARESMKLAQALEVSIALKSTTKRLLSCCLEVGNVRA